ncbi:F-box domain-containing protein [Mycena sanguinolenta]|uniref:F-box domain-containing protein n=1 Tax=Mycena sanguinolenta TaxID=230812 RepID=A0A8H6XZ11_9AGAR|nr:F-box domain-containing protein [Mycena sanguinolenta]
MTSPSALRARLAELDEETDALESRLRLIATERGRVVDNLNSVVYPVVTLPPEITSEIFSHYILDPRLGRPRISNTPTRGPLTLAGICRSWRCICFSTNHLWASLRIYLDRSWVVDDFIHVLKCWLQCAGIDSSQCHRCNFSVIDVGRLSTVKTNDWFESSAGSHPLDLHVYGYESTLSTKTLSVISQYSHQLRAFRFSIDTPYSFPNEEFRGRLPLLTNLGVTILTENDTPVMVTGFRDAPQLREASLSGASLQWISLPWIQLTHLEYSDEFMTSCLQVLHETPNLEVFDVYASYLDTGSQLPRHLTLSHLHTLRFSYDPDGELLERLVLPALKTLHLAGLRSIPSLIDLGTRSAWLLQSLCLSVMTVENCLACLRCLSSVVEVEFQSLDSPDRDLNDLITHLHRDKTIVPALKMLAFRDCGTEFTGWQLGDMLATRASGAHDGMVKLESFRLVFSSGRRGPSKAFVQEIWEELRPAMDAGLQVRIDSPDSP